MSKEMEKISEQSSNKNKEKARKIKATQRRLEKSTITSKRENDSTTKEWQRELEQGAKRAKMKDSKTEVKPREQQKAMENQKSNNKKERASLSNFRQV